MSKDIWPKTIWMLTAKNIKIGSYGSGECMCLRAWCRDQLSRYPSKVYSSFCERLKENLVKNGSCLERWRAIPAHNDWGGLSSAQLAEAWNMTLADFGYVEIDESEWKYYE